MTNEVPAAPTGRDPGPIPLAGWLATLPLPPLTAFEVDVTVLRNVHLPSPASAVVRGLLGERLRHNLCLTGVDTCKGCTVRRNCDYDAVFGTENAAPAAAGGLGDLHPFWLQGIPAVPEVPAGTRLTARLVTAGLRDAVTQSLHLAFRDALGLLGETDKQRGVGAPLLSASRAGRWSVPIAPCTDTTWWIEARTPLLLAPARGDRHLPPCPAAPWLPRLLAAGIRRLKALAQTFGAAPADAEDVPAGSVLPGQMLPVLRDTEVLSGAFRPWSGAVTSRRQGRSFPLDGLTGGVLLRGSALPAVGPLLRALEITGAGNKTTMGFGHLAVEAVR